MLGWHGFDVCANVQVMLKCADIGHLAAAPDVHRRWALLLEEEFFLQVFLATLSKRAPCCEHYRDKPLPTMLRN